jgi:hypothetical protein
MLKEQYTKDISSLVNNPKITKPSELETVRGFKLFSGWKGYLPVIPFKKINENHPVGTSYAIY